MLSIELYHLEKIFSTISKPLGDSVLTLPDTQIFLFLLFHQIPVVLFYHGVLARDNAGVVELAFHDKAP